ncbi:ABC transporter permease [Umezawaea tangerina]|uniref:ABC-2 type transport system permease protein n=1 Tax=Umezawaea tangerina TaxID=84725 RepID=A0A2T0SKX8_9PSEU|nr:ABC-2 family transporter protein [Umezawaea tangerina]PRY34068.1 ABC-2 type transport system permease protein [Umezawaea tangerina]
MRGYRALARISAKNALTYRLEFAFALFGVLFQFVALLAVWRVLLADSTTGTGFTWPQMRGYLLVAFASGAVVGLFADFRMSFRIRSGLVALDLIKPVRYQEARFAEVLGGVWIEVLVVLLVGGVTVLVAGAPTWPGGAELALFTASMVLLIPLKFLVVYLCGLASFWTQNYVGVQWARIAIVNLFSGALVPLAYLPGWLASVAAWSPFAGMTSTPGLILIGRATGAQAAFLVAVQLGWVVVLWFGAKLLWRTAVRQLTVNGG